MTISFPTSNFQRGIVQPKTSPIQTKSEVSSKDLREYMGLPNGYTVTPDCKIKVKHSVTDLFDIQYKTGVTLSDGTKLLRPVILSLGNVDIRPTDNPREYKVSLETGKQRIMKEEELLANKALSRGRIKDIGEGKYNLQFIDINGKGHSYNATKKGALTVLRDNLLYM